MEKIEALFLELKEACKKIGFDSEIAIKEAQELIGDLKVIDYYVTTDIPSEFFEGALMDSCILTDKVLLGYEVKQGNISLFHIIPLSNVVMITEGVEEEKGVKYITASFFWGPLAGLVTSAKTDDRERLRKFLIRVNGYIMMVRKGRKAYERR